MIAVIRPQARQGDTRCPGKGGGWPTSPCRAFRRGESGRGRYGGEPLVDDSPEAGHGMLVVVEKIFKEAGTIKRLRIGISLVVLAKLADPISRFLGVDHGEKMTWVKVGPAVIIENPEIIGGQIRDRYPLLVGDMRDDIHDCDFEFVDKLETTYRANGIRRFFVGL